MENFKYAVLMETSGYEYESWMYFIRYNGNEENLALLGKQLDLITDCSIFDEDINIFDLDLEHLVSETTAKEICLLELNSVSYHRKFDGVLRPIDFRFKSKDKSERMLEKVNKLLGEGRIDEFIGDEDIDESQLNDGSDSDSESVYSSTDEEVDDSDKESDTKDIRDATEQMSISSDEAIRIPSSISNIPLSKKNKRN
jgi:hypothetical protein